MTRRSGRRSGGGGVSSASVTSTLDARKWKEPVMAATTANITLSGTQTVDGVALVAGDRCLVKNQTTATQNKIYTVAAGAWAATADSGPTVVENAVVLVLRGTANGGVIFRQDTPFADLGGDGQAWTAANTA